MSDFRLNVIAETQAAERKLQQVEKLADTAVKPRKLNIDVGTINKSFADIKTNVEGAANSISQFYKVSKSLPVIGSGIKTTEETVKNLAKSTADLATAAPGATVGMVKASSAGSILSRSLKTAASSTDALITKFARLGLSLYAITESTNILKAAFGGLFSETVGRAARFQETLLKTQTTLASTNKVFRDGVELTDPLEKVLALQGAIEERVKSIRDRSIDLAGVTSNEVVEVFGIVASQIGQVGGGLKEAEDLAINFAAALGTFGLPLYQANQEIGSILRGDVGPDSYLARALGITNKDLAKARTEAGGVIKFIQDKLAPAVAGQTIAAKGLEGVLSNIRDIVELVNQAIGEPILDPIITASTALYNVLFSAKDTLTDIGATIGKLFSSAGQRIAGAFQLGDLGELSLVTALTKQAPRAFATIKQDLTGINNLIGQTLTRLGSAFRELFTSLTAMSASTVRAFRELLDAFIQLQLLSFESLISAIATLAQGLTPIVVGLTEILKVWADILRQPIVQFLAQISITFAVLQKTGVIAIAAIVTQLVIWSVGWKAIVAKVKVGGAVIQGVIKSISLSIGSVLLLLAQATAALKGMFIAQGADARVVKQLTELETQFEKIGRNSKGLAYNFRNIGASIKTLGRSLGALVLNVIKANAVVIAVTVGITLLVDAFGRWKRAQEEARQALRDTQVINNYVGSVQYLNRELTVAEQKLKDAALAAADKRYDEATERIVKLREELEKLRKELDKDKASAEAPSARRIRITPREDIAFETYGARRRKRRLIELEKELMAQRKKEADALAVLQEEKDKQNIRTAAENRVNLVKEIGELSRQIDNDLFQQRQALAQKEVEIFRAAGELRIKQIERANEKLLEGEEGASRAALEALNNYIATRERGELEIEAAKKTIAIEVANLEKSIADYQLDIAKKIAEIEKKSADYKRQTADAQQRAAGGTGGAVPTGPAGALSQLIGAHESYGGNYGAYNRGGSNQGRTAHGSGIDPNLVNMTIAEIQRRQLAPGVPAGQQLHAVGKYQIIGSTLRGLLAGSYGETGVTASDKFTPAVQDKLFAALARGRVIPGDVAATERGLKQEWVGLQNADPTALRAAVQQLMGGAAPSAPAAGAGSDIPDATEAADNYAAAVRNLTGAMERFRAIQEAITNANTAEAFDRIAQAFFPRAQLEQYEDRLNEVRFTYDAVAASSAEAFNPERSAIQVTRLAQLTAASRELEQVQKGIADKVKAGQLSETERAKALDAINARYKQHLRDVEQEAAIKQRILATEQATALLTQLRDQARNVRADIEALQLRNRLEAEGFAPEFIQAELAKLNIQREVNRFTDQQNELLATQIQLRDELQQRIAAATDAEKPELEKQLTKALATIERLRAQLKAIGAAGADAAAAEDARAQAATEPGTRIRSFIGAAERELKDFEGMAIRVSQGIGDAVGSSLENGITGLIEGTTTAKEIFADFLKDVGRILIREGTKMIAMYIAIGIAKQFAGLFSSGPAKTGPVGPIQSGGDFNLPGNITTSTFAAANGAYFDGGTSYFANGGVVSAPTLFQFANGGMSRRGVMGEAGPEAIMPLKRGADGKLGVQVADNRAFLDALRGDSPENGTASDSPEELATLATRASIREVERLQENRTQIMTQQMEAERRYERERIEQMASTPGNLNIRYESQVINNVEYVTRDQAERMAAQSALRGRELAIGALQNSVKTRKRVGI